MAEIRIRANSINTNENRKRLKVKETKEVSPKYRNRSLEKRAFRFKRIFTILTIFIIAIFGYFNLQKRKQLNNKRYEYNTLMNEVISKQLKKDRLNAKLENAIDLNRIQRYALEELGMVYANNDKEVANENGN
ncbi:hypothetical protein [Anaerococcus sp. Marseille-P9784]|uniref:hypothetical protein n=1 Tax=Anaerococcus sp. Marseille-P9784 TaxID=2614127 RepID=UPI00124A66AA|nr:hypothetical protein [Anaerococcus sp. Marseille-P9784]